MAVAGLAVFAVGSVPLPWGGDGPVPASETEGHWAERIAEPLASGIEEPLPPARASAAFARHWRDGKAELSGYAVTTMRYGEPREATAVLIYVAEPMDRRVWVKDDAGRVPAQERVEVLKLNQQLRFRTGIYDYSVMTSVFSPLEGAGRERFAPAKISMSAQEWCGHVYQQLHPKGTRMHSALHSYFWQEGDARESIRTPPFTLYEDALLIQLRELDGPFAGGGDWAGHLVPSLWTARKAHRPLRPVPATIRRTAARLHGAPVTRFVLSYDGYSRTFDVERAPPRRVLAWRTAEGERARLLRTVRRAYWRLNARGHEGLLTELGFRPAPPAAAPVEIAPEARAR